MGGNSRDTHDCRNVARVLRFCAALRSGEAGAYSVLSVCAGNCAPVRSTSTCRHTVLDKVNVAAANG